MAAATAVTTVAPAVANAVDVTKSDASISEVVGKVRKALDDRYTDKGADGINEIKRNKVDDYLNSKYAVLVNVSGAEFKEVESVDEYKGAFKSEIAELNDELEFSGNWYVVEDADDLGNLMEDKKSEKVKVAIIDKGHDGGKSTRDTKLKHYTDGVDGDFTTNLKEDVDILFAAAKSSSNNKDTYVQTLKVDGEEIVSGKNQTGTVPDDVRKAELTFTSGETLTLEIGGDSYDLAKARDKNGNKIDLNATNSKDVLDSVTKFDTIKNKDDESREVDLVNGEEVEAFEINAEQIIKEIDLKGLYTKEDGYSEKGADMVNDYRDLGVNERFNMDGVNYIVTAMPDLDAVKIKKDKDSYKFEFTMGVKLADDVEETKDIKFIIRSNSQGDLITVLDDMKKDGDDIVSGRFTKVAGSNRYATAIAVSEEQFDQDNKEDRADTVVIVGGKAQMDGLSAAPLAAAKNAPILLADPNSGLNKDTLNEIDRVADKLNKKIVYIVGGTSSVPASVEKQLKDKFGCSVVRISGNDRLATSLAVTKRMVNDEDIKKGSSNIYLVGRDGAADAMSISAVASKKDEVAPILVVDSKGIDRGTRDYLQDRVEAKKAYLIGGNKSLSTTVFDDAKKIANNKDVTRLSGANRFETNVSVIKSFYKDPKAEAVFFASGEDQYLVDAQTSGVFAASKKAPIMLTGKKLTDNQVKLMNDGELLEKDQVGKNVYQIGGVVSSDVMKVVVDKLDL